MRLGKFLLFFCILVIFAFQSYGLAFTSVDFGVLNPGDSAQDSAQIGGDETDNTYNIDIEGAISDWINFTPESILVPANRGRFVNVNIKVPRNASPGVYQGYLTATGVNGLGGGGQIGFALQVKSRIKVVVNGTPKVPDKFNLSIVSVSPNVFEVSKGEEGKISVQIKNSGNVDGSGTLILNIKKGNIIVKRIALETNLIKSNSSSVVDLYFDTNDLSFGNYNAELELFQEGEFILVDSYKPINFKIISSKMSSEDLNLFFATILFIVILFSLLAFYEKYKNKKTNYKIDDETDYTRDNITDKRIDSKINENKDNEINFNDNRRKDNISKKIKSLFTHNNSKNIDNSINYNMDFSVDAKLDVLEDNLLNMQEEQKVMLDMIEKRQKSIDVLKSEIIDLKKQMVLEQAKKEEDNEEKKLVLYIKDSLDNGKSSQDIEDKLVLIGWPKDKIYMAFKKTLDMLKNEK